MFNIMEGKKPRKMDLKKQEAENQKLEVLLKNGVKIHSRIRQEFNIKQYKKIALKCSIVSLILLLVSIIWIVIALVYFIDHIPQEKHLEFLICLFAFGAIISISPFMGLAAKTICDSELGEMIIGRHKIKPTLDEIDRCIEKCQHYCDLFIEITEEKANHDYLVSKSQTQAKRALFRLLRLTNECVGSMIFYGLPFKKKKRFCKRMEEQIKHINGGIIVAYKGRIPKYVSDAIERVGKNIVLLKGES